MAKQKGFIKNTRGNYKVEGSVTDQEIIDKASELLYRDLESKPQLTSSSETGRFLQNKLGGYKNEVFGVLFLNAQHAVIAFEEMFFGTIDAAAIYQRPIVQRALELNAAALILSHVHPSGGALASSLADRQITKRIIDALALIEVKILDHIIVNSNGYMSMAERGEL